MRVGLIARADRTGLAAQTWTFWRNMKPDTTLVVDLYHCSRQRPEMERYAGDPNVTAWENVNYPGLEIVPDQVVEDFLDQVDVVFAAETFYSWWLVKRAKEKGVRTVLQPNYEFFEHFVARHLPEPDVFALPTMWFSHEVVGRMRGREVVHLPVPVDTELIPYRPRTQLGTILHTTGVPAMRDRNGTIALITAMHLVKTPVQAVIKALRPFGRADIPGNTRIEDGTKDYWDLYGDEDVYVLPRKFGGLCLPMQEALAAGMPTVMSRCPPQAHFLPQDLLVTCEEVDRVMTRALIPIHETRPPVLAEHLDRLYEHPEIVAATSKWAQGWAQEHSWERLRPVYQAVLEGRTNGYRDYVLGSRA